MIFELLISFPFEQFYILLIYLFYLLIFILFLNIIEYSNKLPIFYQRVLFFILLSFIIFFYFVSFCPTVYCEGIEDPFSRVKQYSDLSSLNTQNMIKETYSGVSGIYIFQCFETGGIYIGSSINLYDRFYTHLKDISSNVHLQNAAAKYGWDSFIFRVIETCTPTELIAREQFNLDILFNNFSKALIYNFCVIAYSTLGYVHTTEAKAAIGVANSGRTRTTEARAAISTSIIGNTNAPRVPVFIYDLSNKLVGEYLSQRKAAKHLNVSHITVQRYIDTGKILQGKFILRSSPLS